MATAKYSALFPHVAPRSRELLHILVHGAANLPTVDGRSPQCYVTAQSRTSMTTQEIGQTINATNIVEGISPHWNEMIYADISEDNSHSEEIIILIIDEPRQLTIAQHRFPWRWFEPFYQYHLNLRHELKQTGQTTCLYISLMHKKSSLSKENLRYFGLEVLLNGFDVPLPNNQSMYAISRIVPDYKSYKHDYLLDPTNQRLGVEFKKLVTPNNQDFLLPDFSYVGYPQLSLASKDSKLPIWKHDFFFSHDNEKDSMFTNRTSAIVIEFYPFQNISNNVNWRITGLLGWTAILLDSRSHDALTSTIAAEGMRTEGLIVESEGDLIAENSKYLTAEVILRLVTQRHPARNLLISSSNNLPVLPSYYDQSKRQNGIEPVYLQTDVPKKRFLPVIQSPSPRPNVVPSPVVNQKRWVLASKPPLIPNNSLSYSIVGQPTFLPPQLYPQPQYDVAPVTQQIEKSDGLRYRVPRINPYDLDDIPTEYRAMLATNYPPRRDDDIDGWFDYFQREVAIYKQAIRRIIQDVIQLRDQHKTLTTANKDLRTKIENFDKKKKVLYEIFEGDKIDKAKIQDIFNRLNAKISAQSLELKENYARIISYEKELARRGELRAQYDALVRTSQARETEIKLMKERMNKAEGLEETVRRQELVIEKLEAMINNYMKQKRLGGAFNDIDRSFLSEHAALGLENQQFQTRTPARRYTAMKNNQQEDLLQQNLNYQQELASLKARFEENTAAWGQEKAELLSKLDDTEKLSTTPRVRISKHS